MGTFFTGCRVENHIERARHFRVAKLLVDTDNLTVDSRRKRLVAAGPLPAA